jgi:hypothetical protein
MGAMKDLAIDQMNAERVKQVVYDILNKEAKNAKTFKRKSPFPQRNQPCPCGSGKKFKHCHEIEYRLKLQKRVMEVRAERNKSK